jgi:hypothetical protein
MFFLQEALDGFQLDPSAVDTIVKTLITVIAAAFGVMWRQAVAESKRKDQLIDKLTDQLIRTADGSTRLADAQMQMVSLHERDMGRR